jgi:hypothetical protein
MNRMIRFALLPLVMIASLSFTAMKKKPRVLVFSKTKGYHHASITVGAPAI